MVFKPLQDLNAIHPRHFQISENGCWKGKKIAIGVISNSFQVANSLATIVHRLHRVGDSIGCECPGKDEDIILIVINHQYGPAKAHAPRLKRRMRIRYMGILPYRRAFLQQESNLREAGELAQTLHKSIRQPKIHFKVGN